ncbi:MAG: hypothetical protein ACRD16_06810 [Thermoanaerobaculia bacterium]
MASSEIQRPRAPGVPRALVWMIAASWMVRALVISVSPFYGFDEQFAPEAAKSSVSAPFVSGMSMPERWRTVRRLSTGDRPFWILAHLLWGSLVPSDGSAAFVLTLLASGAALLALAGAARRIGGSDLAVLVAAAGSLSPLAFHYSTSVLAPPLSAMWICIALYAFSSRGWAASAWLAGGLCLGLAFGTHMGAGAPILGLGAALAAAAVAAARSSRLPVRERMRRLFLCPAAAAAGAVLPLLLLEAWARSAGETYLGRLRHHENLNYAGVGPFGLWVRQLFELDPMIEVVVAILLIAAIRRGSTVRRRKAATFGAALLLALLAISFQDAPPRAFVSVALFAAVGIALAAAFGGGRPLVSSEIDPEPSLPDDGDRAPLSRDTVLLAAAVTALVFTVWRPVSCMPRVTFAAWPLIVLALALAARRFIFPSLARPLALLACILALSGAYAVLRLRNIPARSEAAEGRHPGWVKLVYEDFWAFDDRMSAAGWLATRASFPVEVIAPTAQLYPIAAYEEEPYKLLFFREMVRDFQLGGIVSWLEAPWAVYFFDPGPTVPPEAVAARRTLRSLRASP